MKSSGQKKNGKHSGRAARVRAGKREKNKEQTKQRILQAALDLFREKGMEGTTTREISRRAGIAEGTLFNYFKTKEDLALYFFQKETDDLIRWFHGEKRLAHAPLAERLFAIVHRQLEYIEPYEDFIGAVFWRSLQPTSRLHPLNLESEELRVRYLRFVRDILGEAEEAGEIPAVGSIGAYAFGIFYLGIVTFWLQDRSRGKQKTLALLDRCLNVGTHFVKRGKWEW